MSVEQEADPPKEEPDKGPPPRDPTSWLLLVPILIAVAVAAHQLVIAMMVPNPSAAAISISTAFLAMFLPLLVYEARARYQAWRRGRRR